MFATGIECSCPTIQTPIGKKRIDELEKCGHYKNWRTDFHLVKELGLDVLRFGGPYHLIHEGPGKYDWSFLDETLSVLRDMKIEPILDLCHFGVPDWIGDFQNEDWPHYFAEFARAAAVRYPGIKQYTVVNEIYIAALYSAEYGFWNECLQSDKAFVRALANLCKANVMGIKAILDITPDATFVQSETAQYFYAEEPCQLERAHFLNERRFLALDLTYAFPMAAEMFRYLRDNGLSEDEYDWFQQQHIRGHCVMGNDYYMRNEHSVSEVPKTGHAKKPSPSEKRNDDKAIALGYYAVAKHYFNRYRMPLMLTETNMDEPYAEYWLAQNWMSLRRLWEDRIPVRGFTWYSLVDQVDWDTALTEDAGRQNPLGLFDLDRKIRPVGKAYKELVKKWRPIVNSGDADLRGSRW
jgi:beta-glucosidase/6-phospho-beta-glucosidase/beta-galactosidase